MTVDTLLKSGRTPDLVLGPLQLWFHGRQIPESTDYWDANWLRATGRCSQGGAVVVVDGPILHTGQLRSWLADLESLQHSLNGQADLVPIEPDLAVTIRSTTLGHLAVAVEITPDQLNQEHRFQFELDQSHLPQLISSLRKTLLLYPTIGLAP